MADPMDPKFAGHHTSSLTYLATQPSIPSTLAKDGPVPPEIEAARAMDIWSMLVVFRLVNAFALSTFFQPDEYYQALEPAWQLAFGPESGAWITWEWEHGLRSSLHPIILAGVYRTTAEISDFVFTPVLRSLFLVLVPKTIMALFAALQDYYMWRLTMKIYGSRKSESTVILALTLLSPWQWFVSTRAFSNSLETTLTTMALYHWPWEWMKCAQGDAERKLATRNLKWCLTFAALAVVLRPTNIIIWASLSLYTLPYADQAEFFSLVHDASIWGSAVLFASNGLDRLFYGKWTFPAANFLHWNLTQNLAVFYGKNRSDYYLTEGIPLLLTTCLPFGIAGLYQGLTGRVSSHHASDQPPSNILRALSFIALALPAALSLISHKEVRFIYPVLPIFLVLAARPVASFFHPFPIPSSFTKQSVLGLIIIVNVAIAAYLGFVHNSGIISVTSFLRQEFELHNEAMVIHGETTRLNRISVGILMPCHSIPWRSHLVYPEIDAWALTCEPPLGLNETEKETYVDEADRFYANPEQWMREEMGMKSQSPPMYFVFFQQLESTMKEILSSNDYEECWRKFNSHWHDDWRRRGDVIVWRKREPVVG